MTATLDEGLGPLRREVPRSSYVRASSLHDHRLFNPEHFPAGLLRNSPGAQSDAGSGLECRSRSMITLTGASSPRGHHEELPLPHFPAGPAAHRFIAEEIQRKSCCRPAFPLRRGGVTPMPALFRHPRC